MRLIKTIFLAILLALSTCASASVLLEHFNSKSQWDAYTLDPYHFYSGSLSAGNYTWGFFDGNTIAFFDGSNWQPGFTPGGEIEDLKPGYPISGKLPIAWMKVGLSIYYFDGKEWKLCDPFLDEPVELATSGGNVWVRTKSNWLGVANKSNPTHFKFIKLYGKPVVNLIHYSPFDRAMTASNDVHPYMFMVLQDDNKVAALYRFNAKGKMVKIHDISPSHRKDPSFNLHQYNNDLILEDNYKYYAYSSDFGAHWIVNTKHNVNISGGFEMFSSMLCTLGFGTLGVQCFDASKPNADPKMYILPDEIDSQNLMFTPSEMGGWYSAKFSGVDRISYFYRIDPVSNQMVDTHISDEFGYLNYISQTALSNGRLIVCGQDHSGKTILGLYSNQKWQVTPVPAAHCEYADSDYSPNYNVWFGFSDAAGLKKSAQMKFLNKLISSK